MNKFKHMPTTIVVHCSATRASQDWGVEDIRRIHVNENGWEDVGYHWIIMRDGTVQKGRPSDYQGAHVGKHNSYTIGVCLIGGVDDKLKPEDNFTDAQYESLKKVVKSCRHIFGPMAVVGHYELDKSKACPSFNMEEWRKNNGFSA